MTVQINNDPVRSRNERSVAVMSHTTYGYTRDRLGFEPDREERRLQHYAGVTTYKNGTTYQKNGHTNGHYNEDFLTGGVYEENLEKFRGV